MTTQSEDGIHTVCSIPDFGTLRVPPAELPTLYFFGMPRGRQPQRYVFAAGDDFGPQYRDFVIEMFGIEGTLPDDFDGGPFRQVTSKWGMQSGTPNVPEKPGAVVCVRWTDGRVVGLYLWRQRILFRTSTGAPPFIEELWHSDSLTWGVAIRNIPDPGDAETISVVKKLADVLPLLKLSLGEKTVSGFTVQQIEAMITEAIEKMAGSEYDKNRPRRFKVSRFAAAWPIAISRTHIYNYVTRDRLAPNGEIEKRYKDRCAEMKTSSA